MSYSNLRSRIGLLFTGILQVTLVAMSQVFIAHDQVIPMLITGFGISFVWTFNVKKAAFGTWTDRFVYAFGTMIGTGLGYFLSNYLMKIWH